MLFLYKLKHIGRFLNLYCKSVFETKNALFGIFRLKIGKNYGIFRNQQPRICRNAKNCAKQKKSILGPKCLI